MRSRNVPALRLEGFDGDWEVETLSSLAGVITGNTPPTKDLKNYGAYIPFLGPADLDVARGIRASTKYLSAQGLCLAREIPPGATLLVCIGSVGKVGQNAIPVTTNQQINAIVSRNIRANDFIFTRIESMAGSIASNSSTQTMPIISKSRLEKISLSIPPTLEEQQAIGAIFTNLDAAINQHTKKHQALQQAKVALMQRMFPQEGQTVPELRLDGFDGEWKLIKLDTFDIKTGPFGSTLHAKDYVSVGTPIVTTEHFKSGQLPNTGDDIPQVSKQDAARLSMYALNEADIVFSRVGSVDINARVTQCQKGWLFSGRVLRLRLDASCDASFLHSALETEQVRTSIISRAVGQTMPSINTKILGATEVSIPPMLEEQQAIGAVFTRLDTLIATEAKYIESLKQTKTALLQRMFI
ncbi:restriction endonuclease subunit S [Actinotignum urinale]|uniref:restriction endonuclease subunit S n=1 Tax=Actinotignum urinale TaxID=190146 RepID=UPI00280AF205|nr:restriction endonuclease subunit S [Actinotignum urinale]